MRNRPLIDRKEILSRVVPDRGRVLRAKYVEGNGRDLFRLVCAADLEGIAAKWRHGEYVTGDRQASDRTLSRLVRNPAAIARSTWLKIKNAAYSLAAGRADVMFAL